MGLNTYHLEKKVKYRKPRTLDDVVDKSVFDGNMGNLRYLGQK